MKLKIFVMAMGLGFAGFQSQDLRASDVTLEAVPLSKKLARAVRINYKYGRKILDNGGVSAIERFKIVSTNTPTLADILEQVIQKSQVTWPMAIKDFCRDTEEGLGLAPLDFKGCAQKIVKDHWNFAEIKSLSWVQWFSEIDESKPDRNLFHMSRALQQILSFLYPYTAKDALEFNIGLNVFSVDCRVGIILHEKKKEVLTLFYDYGA